MAAAGGVLLAFLPAPQFAFLDASFGTFSPFPPVAEAGAAELDEMAAAAEAPLEDDRVVGTEAEAGDFTMIGLSLDEPPTEPVMVRVREDDGAWGEWNELEFDDDHAPDAGTGEASEITTEPLWVGESQGYQLSVAEADQDGAEVALVRDRAVRVVAESTPLADAATSPAPFPISPRSAWNVRSTSTSTASALKMAVVHHTASTNSYSPSQVPGILRSTQAYHMDARGWSDIGYNFLIDRFGGIWEGRGGGMGRAVIGAHAAGFNTGSVGVSVIGNFTDVAVPSAAREAIARVVGWRLESYGVDPGPRRTSPRAGARRSPRGRSCTAPTSWGTATSAPRVARVPSTIPCSGSVTAPAPGTRRLPHATTRSAASTG